MRAVLGTLLAAVAVASPLPPVAAAEPGAPPVLVVEGRGWGHGVGMPQEGAYSLALDGAGTTDILGRFYPGTSIGRGGGTVRVEVLQAAGQVVVALPAGGEVRDAQTGPQSPGFPVTVVPGGSVGLSFDGGKFHAKPLSGATLPVATTVPAAAALAAPPPPPTTAKPATTPTTGLLDGLLKRAVPALAPTTTAAPAAKPAAPLPAAAPTEAVSPRSLWAVPRGDGTVALPAQDRRYRGAVQATAGGPGLTLVNHLDVEQYLRGMGEVLEPSWPAAALRAQAIAARTYALWTLAAGRNLCDTQQCQVYLGAGAEYGAMDAAVAATRGQVVTYHGALAQAVYSANAGGVSATAEEGFGPGSIDEPYLQPVHYQARDPRPFTAVMTLAEAGTRLGYPGEVSDLRISRTGPSGRVLEVTVDGTAGPLAVDGHRAVDALRLQSNLFALRVDRSPAAADLLAGESSAVSSHRRAGRGVGAVGAGVAPAPSRGPWVVLAAGLLVAAWSGTRRLRRRPARVTEA
jgi:stage II sporulation protein D